MIKVIEIPQRADNIISYSINQDIISITIDEKTEELDFTYLPEGKMDSVIFDKLQLNPIISISKVGSEVEVKLLRFYSAEEKELFEIARDTKSPTGGALVG